MASYKYKDIEPEDYGRNEQSKLDKKITKALITGDYSELSELTPGTPPLDIEELTSAVYQHGHFNARWNKQPDPKKMAFWTAEVRTAELRARIDEIKRKMTLYIERTSPQDYRDGFYAALDQIDKADAIRISELEAQLEQEQQP
jgi:hypothetical protein